MEQIYFCTTKIEPRHMLFDKVKREQQVWWGNEAHQENAAYCQKCLTQ